MAMFLHIEERRAWLRSQTHTVVLDRDPEFRRFARDPSGTIHRTLRIWIAEMVEAGPQLRGYLGSVTCGRIGPSTRDLCRLFRLTSRTAVAMGESATVLRRQLAKLLRQYTA